MSRAAGRVGRWLLLAPLALGAVYALLPGERTEPVPRPAPVAARGALGAAGVHATVAPPGREPEPYEPEAKRPVPARASSAEPAFMTELHRLKDSDPEEALRRVQAANELEPGSVRAPERQWIAVRALVNLQRFEAAREEALAMVTRFPDDEWTLDAARHLLTHPLGLPPRETRSRP